MEYVRNAWYVASWTADLQEAKPLALTILDEPIVLYRSAGTLVALEDRCVHRLAPLSLGRCEAANLRCMYHGLLFDPTGRVIEIPGQDTIPPQARVRAYPVVDRHSWAWVWMGDPAKADVALIPAAVGLDHPDYTLGHGQLDYAAEARLINDNLLDFSHLTFVHANSFGSDPDFARVLPDIKPIPRGIRYLRWIENSLGSSSRKTETPMDNFMAYDFLLPGILLMQTGVFPPGTARASEYGYPDPSAAAGNVSFTSQAVTPMQEKTARYFFSWGPHRAHGDEATRDAMMRVAAQAFAEDKTMIEAQQRVIDRTPNPRVMPTAHDKAVTLFNRLVATIVRDEQGAQTASAA
ncbi:vanillate O-demethylase monooxygenase subunit [Novosphingobium capsulatum]|uniref:Vanillate O-demethylase monooxygenase subunit n=1 Tax=Novosphingobium capsulatum TaxID=13688 RepID=A0ABU1MSX8_9SPHN|nr:aromatic ring-hydroxylating dioxygenase subunit alpha [Novosphingobium capsulatum]MDR6513096.1 vanillate O-demethylase monooxygenase subunit [Novosphingobium capsulatum]